uniref:Ig-like domain-containing protein n=1 Tax=Amphimedon queenslandica TaxID=400682 RepID=A0A1X7VCC1_AMPQE
ILSVNLIPASDVVFLEYGDSYNLTCASLSVSSLSVQISWYKDDELINNTETQVLTLNYTSPESVSNGGSYKCIAQGTIGSSIGESNSVLIIFAPHIIQTPSNIQTRVARKIQFICNATGYPLPSIEWRRISVENDLTTLQDIDNVTVDLPYNITNDSSINMNEVSSVLTLQSVDYDDFGYYVCIATLTSDDVYVLLNNSNVTLMDYHAISSTATLTVSPLGSVQVNPSSVLAYYGETVVLNCTSRGGPNNQYTWDIESGAIVIGRSDQLTLELNNLRLFSYYQCRVSNDAGSDRVSHIEVRDDVYVLFNNSNVTLMDYHAISSTATLTVSPYGSVQINPNYIATAYYGDTVVFNCTSRGGPNNQYTWYRLAESGSITVGLMNQLEIEISSFQLFSFYYCIVTNDAGSSSAFTILNGMLSVSIIPSTATVLNLGDSITLFCVVNHNISNPSDILYDWYFNNDVLVINGSSSLTLSYSDYSSVNQGAYYACFPYNNAFLFFIRGVSPHVPVLFSPSFSEQPDSVISKVNDSVELSCTAFGYPVPVIEWNRVNSLNTSDFINNIIELPENAYNDTVAGTNNITSTLIIDDIQYEDFGYYLCVATMSSSELSGDIQVLSSISTVTVSPEGSVNISSNGTDTKIGDTVRLVCSSRGGPNNQYSWTYHSSNETIGNEPELILAIDSVDQFGEYKCSVSNKAGTDNSTSIVN